MTFSIDVDEPKLARSLKRRLSRRVRLQLPKTKDWDNAGRFLVALIWPFIAEAYSAGYKAGHEDQMQMRIRDAMERERPALAKGTPE